MQPPQDFIIVMTAVQAAIGGAIIPTGTILNYGGTVAPEGFVLCIGQTALREDYAGLISWAIRNNVIGENKLFGEGDGSTTFVFPDLRETVLVGAGHNTTHIFDSTETNPNTGLAGTQNHDVYDIGEFKDDQFQSHTHSYTRYDYRRDVNWSSSARIWVNESSANTSAPTGRTGSTTHGKQIGINYIIKF